MDLAQQKFIDSAIDLIADLENSLLVLENNPNDAGCIESVFRAMHTLKGTSGMFGFDKIGEITHQLETIYDFVRDNHILLSLDIINLTLYSVDHIKALLQDVGLTNETNVKNHQLLMKNINNIIADAERSCNTEQPEPVEEQKKIVNEKDLKTYYILLEPDEDLAERGVSLQSIFDELTLMGECKTFPYPNSKTGKFYLLWEIYLITAEPLNNVDGAFIFVQDQYKIHLLAEKSLFARNEFNTFIEEQSKQQEPINLDELKDFIFNLDNNISVAQTKSQLNQRTTIDTKTSSIKVASGKLDNLMNLVSELITTQAELSLIASRLKDPALVGNVEKIEKLSRQLRDNALNVRLVPLDMLLVQFKRLVRDLSSELKKDIDFIVQGSSTELDKTIIDCLADPIMHIIRNSIDHGIETAEERKRKGKLAKGMLYFNAYYSGVNVVIEIKDDGAGIDLEKIRETAIRKGFIAKDQILTDKELLNLIFISGFSTSEKVSEVSGRGVGLDVVNQKINALRGEIEINTKINEGTSFTIKLPLTLSIVDALLVKVDEEHFLIPLSVVEECAETNHNQIINASNNRIVVSGNLLPFVYLRSEFEITENCPTIERIIVAKHEGNKIGIVVDRIVGEHQAVLKPLGEMFKNQNIVSGGSILGDGNVALVLDTNRLIKQIATKQII